MPEITLVFRNDEEREVFMGQLSDGWGENHCDLKWDGNFDTATRFEVRPVCVDCDSGLVGDCECSKDGGAI